MSFSPAATASVVIATNNCCTFPFLLYAEAQLVARLQHVQRARIPIEFGGKRQPHAPDSPQVPHLPLAEGFDVALLQARIGQVPMLVLLPYSRSRHQD